jgi:hypothetical protein
MKKKILCIVLLAFTFSLLNAQENIIKAAGVTGNLGLQYERSISSHFSVVGQLGYSNLSTTVNNKAQAISEGLGYYLEGRYYFSPLDNRMQGWHIGPYYNSINTKNNKSSTIISSLGISTGYQWILNSQITINAMLGVGTMNVKSDEPLTNFLKDFGFFDLGFLPQIGLSFGYVF